MTINLSGELSNRMKDPILQDTTWAVTRPVDAILKQAKDLPPEERTDTQLLNFLHMAMRGVEFTKMAQITQSGENTSFDSLSLSTGRCFGRPPRKSSYKCGDNKRNNGLWRGKTMTCHDCEIYLDPSKEFELKPDQIFKHMKPLYGLSDSGDRWHFTLKKHHLEDLKMIPTDGDLSLYTKHIEERIMGLSGVYVDDTIRTGDERFKKWAQKTSEKYQASARKISSAKFDGMDFTQSESLDSVTTNMDKYVAKLILLLDSQFIRTLPFAPGTVTLEKSFPS